MGEADRTWIILYCTKALFACVSLHVFSSIKMSKRKQATLGEFGFSQKVCHRDGEVDVIIPNFVEDKDIVKRIQCGVCTRTGGLWEKSSTSIEAWRSTVLRFRTEAVTMSQIMTLMGLT